MTDLCIACWENLHVKVAALSGHHSFSDFRGNEGFSTFYKQWSREANQITTLWIDKIVWSHSTFDWRQQNRHAVTGEDPSDSQTDGHMGTKRKSFGSKGSAMEKHKCRIGQSHPSRYPKALLPEILKCWKGCIRQRGKHGETPESPLSLTDQRLNLPEPTHSALQGIRHGIMLTTFKFSVWLIRWVI